MSEPEKIYLSLRPWLLSVLREHNIPEDQLQFAKMKDYWSATLGKGLLFRIKVTKQLRHLTCKQLSDDQQHLFDGLKVSQNKTELNEGFVRIQLPAANIPDAMEPLIRTILLNYLDSFTAEFDCCSRYESCSSAKHCIHPDALFSLSCGYRHKLRQGVIFYGKNRNVD